MTGFRAALRSLSDFILDARLVIGDAWRRLPGVLAMMLLAMGFDLLGVALVSPFLSVLLYTDSATPPWFPMSEFLLHGAGLRWLAIALFVTVTLKGLVAYATQRRISQVTETERAKLMDRLLGAYQGMPYELHLRRNSADLVNVIVWYTQAYTSGVLGSTLRLFADLLVFIALGAFLAWTDLRAVAILLSILAAVFLVVGRFVRPPLMAANQLNANLNSSVYLSVSQALMGLREVRILGREQFFRERLRSAANGLAESSSVVTALQLVPRQAIEVAVIGFLVALVWLTRSGNSSMHVLVPVLGTFAFAAIRLMPASTAILGNWNTLRASRFALRELAKNLSLIAADQTASMQISDRPVTDEAEKFRELEVDSIDFTYADALEPALKGMTFKIRAGEVVAFVGRSGSGKSTLADIVLGLLSPQKGAIRVNGWDVATNIRRWHTMVAYIPQAVYLIDDTLRRNIALGVPDEEVSAERVDRAVKDAQLGDLVAKLPAGLDTVIGERGTRFSGGQRQRVAIARALYYDRQFLLLDEATSALDSETEEAVLQTIKALHGNRTLLVIAHKPSLIAGATTVIRLD